MRTAILALGLLIFGTGAQAGAIEQACLASDRPGKTRELCGCIQQAADVTLSRSDQRTAARLFRDPERAQSIRTSSSRGNEAFWQNYRNFGAMAQAFCSAG